LLAIDLGDGQPHVHQDEVAGDDVGLAGQADLAADAAEADVGERQPVARRQRHHFAGDP